MKFDYKKFGKNAEGVVTIKPIIPITLIGREEVQYEVLVDSGADICIFDIEMAELMGLDAKRGEKVFFAGVTGTQRVAYIHNIKIAVGGHILKTRVAFAPLPPQGHGFVGQRGFFEFFRVVFDYQKKRVELREKSSAKNTHT